MKDQDQTTRQALAGTRRTMRRRASVAFTAIVLIASLLALTSPPATAAEATTPTRVVVKEGESIQAAIDAAAPGSTIIVRGNHVENLWVNKSGIQLIGWGATLTNDPAATGAPCSPDPTDEPSLICVAPPTPTGPPAPGDYLDGFTIRGFTLSTTSGFSIASVFTNNVVVKRNTITGSACDGVFVIFSTGVRVVHNSISNSACSGITVNAGSRALIQKNTVTNSTFNGIAVNDVDQSVIRRNTTSNNCIGIGVADGKDGGYGIRPEPFPGGNTQITANIANDNNKTCPFGPATIGLNGILVAGVDGVVVRNNTTNNNAGTVESATATGIGVIVFPELDGSVSPSTRVTVANNRALGNSSAAGPRDLWVEAPDGPKVRANTCGTSAPDPSWCG